jgi:hypothetical protein
MAKRTVEVGGNEVRAWGIENAPTLVAAPREGETFARGRISNALVLAYETANPGNKYVAGHKSESIYTLTERTTDARGRNRSRKVEVSLSQVRELAGEGFSSHGVPSAEALAAAEETLSAQAAARKASKSAKS